MEIDNLILIIVALSIVALAFTWCKTKRINAQSFGTPRMAKIAAIIQEGATAILKAEYKILFIFVVTIAVLLGWSGSQNP